VTRAWQARSGRDGLTAPGGFPFIWGVWTEKQFKVGNAGWQSALN
jgi:hypothetical protein